MNSDKKWKVLDWKKAALGTGVAIVASLALMAILAWLISAEKVALSMVDAGRNGVLFLSALCGGVVAGTGDRGVLNGLTVGLSYLVLLLCANALLLDGIYMGVGTGAATILVGASIPLALNKLSKKRRNKHGRKRRNR